MAKLYGVVLVITLVVASGFIAYVGDILGRRMGRKRLSLFGLRPRHTAIAVSVVAGMLITMFTLAVAMIASRDVRQGLLHAAEMRRQQTALAQQVREAEEQVKYLEESRRAAQRRVAEAQRARKAADTSLDETNARLGQTKERLGQTNVQLAKAKAELAAIQARYREASGNLHRAEKAFRDLSTALRSAEHDVRQYRGVLMEALATPILVGAGQPLDMKLIQGGLPKTAIRSDLNGLLDRLAAKARAAGAAASGGDVVVLDKRIYDPKKQKFVTFTKIQVINAVVEAIHQARGGVIARAESAINSYAGEPVYIDIKLYNNRLVFHQGEVLAEAVVDGRRSEPALMDALVGLLRSKVGPEARKKNMMPRLISSDTDPFGSSSSTVGAMTNDQLFGKIEELRRIGGPAKVSVFAAEDAWTIGPLKVDMRIEPAQA